MLWPVQILSSPKVVGFWIFLHKCFFINCFEVLQHHHSVKLRENVFFKKRIFLNLQKVSAGCENLEEVEGVTVFS